MGNRQSEDLESCPGEKPAAGFATTTMVVLYGAPCEELLSHYTHFQMLWITTQH